VSGCVPASTGIPGRGCSEVDFSLSITFTFIRGLRVLIRDSNLWVNGGKGKNNDQVKNLLIIIIIDVG